MSVAFKLRDHPELHYSNEIFDLNKCRDRPDTGREIIQVKYSSDVVGQSGDISN